MAAATTRDEVAELIREAIEMHLEGLKEDGEPIPDRRSSALEVSVSG